MTRGNAGSTRQARHGLFGRLVRWSQFLTDEAAELQGYSESLAAGSYVLVLHVEHDSPRHHHLLAHLRRVGARDVRDFGPVVTDPEG